jgi:hypothetical protein
MKDESKIQKNNMAKHVHLVALTMRPEYILRIGKEYSVVWCSVV